MNKHCYRVVFNKARGMMMVVSEAAKSNSKMAGDGSRNNVSNTKTTSNNPSSLSRLVVAILCCQSMIYTQVQAATSAIQNTASNIPVDQRAALLRAPNGTPIVNIRTPNSNGLSHNTYNQFDIGTNGAVLNNSMGGANTHLAGAIAGNQYLGKNVANTILNEVRSNAPAKFQGNLEVAGQRADVIIASPSGLQIQGGGFINANRATLTTGTPKIDSAGNLTGFDVKQGQIQFDNATTGSALGGVLYDGKTKNQANYVDVLARAVTINGQIHANQDVDMVIGSNTVDYETGAATKIVGTGVAPTLAVDVSTLGGIYANSINLIGNESGLGVKNAGNIKATQQVVLTNSGKIENIGSIETTKAQTSLVSINATGTTGSIEHSGTISSYGMIDVQADKDITLNKGIIKKNNAGTAVQLMPDIIRVDATGNLKISNSSDIRNFTIDDKANIYLHSGLDTTAASKSTIASNGGVSIDADRYAQLTDTSSISTGNAALTISSKAGTLVDNASITGRGDIYINSTTADTTISNNSQLSAQKSLVINAGRDATLKSGSKIVAANDLTIAATRNATIDTAGSVKVTTDATIKAGELAYLKDSAQPITIGKQLAIEGKQATVLNSTANANDGIYITSQGKATTITNSTLNSTKGSVTAIANQAALNVNNLTTTANSTILAAGSNIGITSGKFNADNIFVESGATTTINGLMTAAKDSKQVGGTSISSKENTNVTNSTLKSTGNTVMRSDKTLTLINNDIQAQGIVLKTNKANTLKNTAGINNTFGDGDITLTKNKLTTSGTNDNSNGIIVDAANHLNVIDTQTKSTGSTSLTSGNLMRVNNSTLDAGKHLNIDSGNQLIFNGARTANTNTGLTHAAGNTMLKAGQVLSIDSNATQSYQNTSVAGAAVIINSDANIAFNGNTSIKAASSNTLGSNIEVSSDGKALSNLNGDLIITSNDDLTIDPKKLGTKYGFPGYEYSIPLEADNDLTLTSRKGKLHLKGYAGTQGLGSEQVVKIGVDGNINLSGKDVLIEGSEIISNTKYRSEIPKGSSFYTIVRDDYDLNITATDGSVELKGVKNSFTNYVSLQKISVIEQQIADVNSEITKYADDVEVLDKARSLIGAAEGASIWVRPSRMAVYNLFIKSASYQKALPNKVIIDQLQQTKADLERVLETSQKASTGFEHKASSIVAGKDINITAKQGVLIEGADISSSLGGINILAEGNLAPVEVKDADDKAVGLNYDSIRITGLADIYQQGDINSKGEVTGNNYSYHQLINQPKLTANKNIIISAKGARPVNQASIVFIDNNAVVLNSADIKSYNGDVRIDAALGDINLEASQVAFMDGSQTTTTKRKWYGKKKTTTTTKTSFNTNAVTTDIAAKNIKLTAESDINIYGSELTADPKGTIGITAGRLNNLYKVEDRIVSETDIKSKSSFLGIRYNKNHTNDTRQELSQLPAILAANSAALKSGGNTLIQGSIFNTENANTIQVGYGIYADANANVILQAITNQIKTTHTQDKESTLWMKTVQESDTVTTAQLPKFNQAPTITLPDGGSIIVDIPVEITIDRNKKAKEAISKSSEELGRIALELSKQPGYEYLAELDKNNDIDWQQVNLIQEHFAFEQEGLTPAAAALIAIAVTIALQGMDGGGIATSLLGQQSAVAGTAATATSAATVGTASTVTTLGLAGNAAMATLASQAAVTLINNKGDISKTLKQLASSATIRSMATAALTAGVGAQLGLGSAATDPFNQKLVNAVGSGMTDAFVNAAINGVSLEDALKNSLRNALVDVFAAQTFSSFVKDIDSNDFADNLAHKLVAAGVGCISASAKKQSCDAGALGAAVGEMFGDYLVDNPNALNDAQKQEIIDAAKLLAGSIALLTNVDVNTAADIAGIAVKNNSTMDVVFPDFREELEVEFFADMNVAEERKVLLNMLVKEYGPDFEDAFIKIFTPMTNGKLASISGTAYLLTSGGKNLLKVVTKNGRTIIYDLKKVASSYRGTSNPPEIPRSAIVSDDPSCFVAGTLVETIDGLKAIETIEQGDMVWSRHENTLEYGYRPVIDTVSFEDKEIYEVIIQDNNSKLETYQTTEEHPFWILDTGWLPTSLLQSGMKLVNRDDQAILTVVSQTKLNKKDTVYNFEVDEFHTYHVGKLGVLVHNTCLDADDLRQWLNSAKNSANPVKSFSNVDEMRRKIELLQGLNESDKAIFKRLMNDSKLNLNNSYGIQKILHLGIASDPTARASFIQTIRRVDDISRSPMAKSNKTTFGFEVQDGIGNDIDLAVYQNGKLIEAISLKVVTPTSNSITSAKRALSRKISEAGGQINLVSAKTKTARINFEYDDYQKVFALDGFGTKAKMDILKRQLSLTRIEIVTRDGTTHIF